MAKYTYMLPQILYLCQGGGYEITTITALKAALSLWVKLLM